MTPQDTIHLITPTRPTDLVLAKSESADIRNTVY
ncbi:MAG: hypothetical protein JWM91_414 [Rhodospirillales bacterium]|nr:hypothetical protein [Rhodospirillales bacterium]